MEQNDNMYLLICTGIEHKTLSYAKYNLWQNVYPASNYMRQEKPKLRGILQQWYYDNDVKSHEIDHYIVII